MNIPDAVYKTLRRTRSSKGRIADDQDERCRILAMECVLDPVVPRYRVFLHVDAA